MKTLKFSQVKENILNRLATAYSLDRMRMALRDFARSNLAPDNHMGTSQENYEYERPQENKHLGRLEGTLFDNSIFSFNIFSLSL